MTTVANIANHIGLEERPGERGVLMAMVNGKPRHAYLGDAMAESVDGFEALYAASGLFRDGSIKGNTGRSAENLTRVIWLPFDADLLDYMGCQPSSTDEGKAARKALQSELGSMPDDELHGLIAALRTDLESTFAKLSIPMHRLDYTGYGLCAYVYVDEQDQTRIDDARAAHKHLVEAVNNQYGDRLVDPQCSDAGTRVTRLPETINRKGTFPRLVQTLIPYTGQTCPLGHRPGTPRPMAQMIPVTGDGMSQEDAQQFIAAMAPFWSLGQRHAVALAVAGMLAKAGIPESQAVEIVAALSHTDGDVWTQSITEVHTTYRRARAGSTIAGFTQLRSLMTPAALAFVDAMLDRYRVASQATSGPVSVGVFDVVGASSAKPATPNAAAFEPTELPTAARYGWIGEYIELVEPTTEAPDSFHFACGMTMLGACIGRRVALFHSSERLHPNLYTLLIGPSGRARKDTAIKRSLALPQLQPPSTMALTTLGIPFRVIRDISSAEGLIRVLSKQPNIYFYATEFSKLMHNATRESTSSIAPTLMEAFDTPTVLSNTVKSEQESNEARNPFLSVMAAVQPEILSDLIGNQQQYSGFLNRWLLIVGDGKGPRPTPPNLDESAGWKLMKRAMDSIQSYPEGSVVHIGAKADERWREWYVASYPSGSASSQEDAMGIRLGTLIKKAALIHAVMDKSSIVETYHLDAAISLVEWSWGHTKRLLPTWGESPDAALQRKIIETLQRKGPSLHKRTIQQYAGNRSGPGMFARTIKFMVENGELVVTPDNMVSIAS